MNKKILFLLCILSTLSLFSQTERPLWVIAEHEVSDSASLTAIQDILNNGYQVTGIDYNESFTALQIVYLLDLSGVQKKWSLYEFSDPATLEEELSAMITSGFRPVDIALGPKGLIGFFVEDPQTPLGWRIERSADFSEIERFTGIYSRIDYSLQGLAQDSKGVYWVLFVRYQESKTNTVFEQLSEERFGDAIAEFLAVYANLGQIVYDTKGRYTVAFNRFVSLQEEE